MKSTSILPQNSKILQIIVEKYDFVFCHIKGADILAEDGNYIGKKEFIEKIDKSIKPFLELKDMMIVVTADHSTSSVLKKHTANNVPVLIYGKDKNGIEKFSEKLCSQGTLGMINQLDLMGKIISFTRKEV